MTAAGRITRDETEMCFLKPLKYEDVTALDSLIERVESRGDAAVKIENETQVKLYIVRN